MQDRVEAVVDYKVDCLLIVGYIFYRHRADAVCCDDDLHNSLAYVINVLVQQQRIVNFVVKHHVGGVDLRNRVFVQRENLRVELGLRILQLLSVIAKARLNLLFQGQRVHAIGDHVASNKRQFADLQVDIDEVSAALFRKVNVLDIIVDAIKQALLHNKEQDYKRKLLVLT